MFCPQDCLELLGECVDETRLPEGVTAKALCQRLSPEDAPCLSLGLFLQPSSEWASEAVDVQLSAPCRGDPCNESEVCLVNRNCPNGKTCPQHTCAKGNLITTSLASLMLSFGVFRMSRGRRFAAGGAARSVYADPSFLRKQNVFEDLPVFRQRHRRELRPAALLLARPVPRRLAQIQSV